MLDGYWVLWTKLPLLTFSYYMPLMSGFLFPPTTFHRSLALLLVALALLPTTTPTTTTTPTATSVRLRIADQERSFDDAASEAGTCVAIG
ncbi:hypothetical protein LINPERHAP2_LOCUS9646 [Linum perenne]